MVGTPAASAAMANDGNRAPSERCMTTRASPPARRGPPRRDRATRSTPRPSRGRAGAPGARDRDDARAVARRGEGHELGRQRQEAVDQPGHVDDQVAAVDASPRRAAPPAGRRRRGSAHAQHLEDLVARGARRRDQYRAASQRRGAAGRRAGRARLAAQRPQVVDETTSGVPRVGRVARPATCTTSTARQHPVDGAAPSCAATRRPQRADRQTRVPRPRRASSACGTARVRSPGDRHERVGEVGHRVAQRLRATRRGRGRPEGGPVAHRAARARHRARPPSARARPPTDRTARRPSPRRRSPRGRSAGTATRSGRSGRSSRRASRPSSGASRRRPRDRAPTGTGRSARSPAPRRRGAGSRA